MSPPLTKCRCAVPARRPDVFARQSRTADWKRAPLRACPPPRLRRTGFCAAPSAPRSVPASNTAAATFLRWSPAFASCPWMTEPARSPRVRPGLAGPAVLTRPVRFGGALARPRHVAMGNRPFPRARSPTWPVVPPAAWKLPRAGRLGVHNQPQVMGILDR